MSDKEDLMTTHKPVSDPILEEAPEGAANPVNDEELT